MKSDNFIGIDENDDGIDRAGFLKCMAWAGTGLFCLMSGGVLKTYGMSHLIDKATGGLKKGIDISKGDFSFVQISDSHIGFNKPANPDVVGTLQAAIDKINAMPSAPSFILHTGDLSHLAQADEFDTLEQSLKSAKTGKVFYVPGEHDVLNDNGKQYLQRFGKDTKGNGWYSYDFNGVHFIGLVNVVGTAEGGLGVLGNEQLQWLENDVKGLTSSTRDSEQALSFLRRFGSVAVLNGHIHQTLQKVEGNITFHTATSTAFPQPQPGMAASAGPMKVPAEQLRGLLGLTSVNYIEHDHTLAVTDLPLSNVNKDQPVR